MEALYLYSTFIFSHLPAGQWGSSVLAIDVTLWKSS